MSFKISDNSSELWSENRFDSVAPSSDHIIISPKKQVPSTH